MMDKKATTEKSIDPIGMTMEMIKELCVGLIYISDTDTSPEPFRLKDWDPPLTIENFIMALDMSVKIVREERGWDFFFSRSIPRQPRWEDLKKFLEHALTERHVYVLGDRLADIYAIGIHPATKSLVGIKLHVVQT